jgi:hypothetical protein
MIEIEFTKKAKEHEPNDFFEMIDNHIEHLEREEKNDGRSDDRAWSILLDAEQKGLINIKVK